MRHSSAPDPDPGPKPWKGRTLLTVLGMIPAGFGLVDAAALSGLFLAQRDLQYFPTRRDPAPEHLGLTGVERVLLPASYGAAAVLWWSAPAPGRPAILFLHGNAGEIADRADRLAFYQGRGYGAAFLSYRGYDGSTGRPSEAGLISDARAAHEFVAARGIAPQRIVLVGESLGAGVAVQLAARAPVGAVVLEAPFTAAVDLAAELYPWAPVRLLMRDRFRNRDHIAAIGAPLLILHGERDAVIPYPHGRALFRLAREPKAFLSSGPVRNCHLGGRRRFSGRAVAALTLPAARPISDACIRRGRHERRSLPTFRHPSGRSRCAGHPARGDRRGRRWRTVSGTPPCRGDRAGRRTHPAGHL
ncbi:MAG: alpha/beta hydrolase [Tabrizicola sp.]